MRIIIIVAVYLRDMADDSEAFSCFLVAVLLIPVWRIDYYVVYLCVIKMCVVLGGGRPEELPPCAEEARGKRATSPGADDRRGGAFGAKHRFERGASEESDSREVGADGSRVLAAGRLGGSRAEPAAQRGGHIGRAGIVDPCEKCRRERFR